MFTVAPQTHPPDHDRVTRQAARIASYWPQVRVKDVQVTKSAAGDRVRALVELGCLTPADVRVELTRAGSGAADVAMPAGGHRLFSSQGYGNGCFVFDTTVPAGTTSRGRDWVIHVHPTEALEEPRVEYRLRH